MGFLSDNFVAADAGNEKFRGDKRQFAGLLFGLSICATFFPMAGLAGLIGPDGTTVNEGVPLARLVAGVCVIAIGLSGMLTGYLALAHDYSNKWLTTWVLIIVQTAWIPYITDMTNVGKMAATGEAFNLAAYNASASDVWVFGAAGILGVFSYGACFLGSLSFMSFSLYAYQAGMPCDRASSYFRGRLRVYSFLVLVAGIAQLMLGVFTISNISNGPLLPPPTVAMFTITFPEISVTVGLLYVINGIWGMYRGFSNPTDNYFQMSIAMQYLFTISLMICVQIFYLAGPTQGGAAPSRGCLTLGAHIMPAFLDYKMRSTPEELGDDYYGDLGMCGDEKANLTKGVEEPLDEEQPEISPDEPVPDMRGSA
mmetsp:Transcript_20919/g.34565  ORF Transcript_20919/g.34565 Transcript_20919/m.34565 type:complete len:368 (+) Transcript_20919:91-1194(+)|eukprot:CAMPEP_0119007688 /NCGR_PEP_ID=MMETSP1176-20130426/3177_1 /TAXON_ID=265551 /ORGANISM="Synedropsis recta cf, Strain CCMP1620" /LENGTH=367 /DNA_ID=CAMNT_0006959883 /DNA_START=83 /DNA_END=1186 /DNA_ORIENTATION=+